MAVAHEDPDVGAVPDGQGLVQQGQHDRHFDPRRSRAARRPPDPGPGRRLQATVDGIGAVLVQVQDGQDFQLLAPSHPPLAAVPAPADPGQLAAALGQKGAVAGPGRIVRVGHHRAQAGQVEGRKVAGAGRLATVRVGAAVAEAGQVAVRGADRQAGRQRQQGAEMVPLRFAAGQVGQHGGQQGHGTPPGMAWRSTNTITGAVLPPHGSVAVAARGVSASRNM